MSTGFSFTKSSFFIILTIFSLSDHPFIIVTCYFIMSIPKGKTQLPPSLRNWCKPINSRHCKYTSSSNFILSAVLSKLHRVGSHNAMLGPFGATLDVVFYNPGTFIHVSHAALDLYAPHWFHTCCIGSSLCHIGS